MSIELDEAEDHATADRLGLILITQDKTSGLGSSLTLAMLRGAACRHWTYLVLAVRAFPQSYPSECVINERLLCGMSA